MAKGEVLFAQVTLMFKQPREGEPAPSDRLIVEQWLEDAQGVSAWVEIEGKNDDMPIDLDSYTIDQVGEWHVPTS